MRATAAEHWTIGALVTHPQPLPPTTACGDLLKTFDAENSPVCLPIVADGRPIGLISRQTILQTFANPIHKALYDWRPVRALMDSAPLILPAHTDVDDAARTMALEKPSAVVDGILVTFEDEPVGVVSAMDLLRRSAERERERAGELERAHRATEEALNDLRHAQTELVEAEKMASLGGLVAGVAHEINTPLGVTLTAVSDANSRLKSFIGMLEGGEPIRKSGVRAFADGQKEALDIALSNIDRAVTLIGGFKQVAVDRTADARRRFEFRAYVDEVLNSVQPLLRRSGAQIALGRIDDVVLDSYPGALAQILTNLVENAIRHGRPEGRAGVISLATELDPAKALLRIRFADDGCGIPDDRVGRIFEPFFTTKRGEGGSGLGLHIVYNLVRARLGGSISAQSPDGAGAVFEIALPLTAPEPESSGTGA